MAIEVVELANLANNDAFVDAVDKFEYTLKRVLRPVRWDLEKGKNNDAVLNLTNYGYIIGFNDSIYDEDILEYVADISGWMRKNELPVRIGVSKGTCILYKDFNSNLNLCGWGIFDAHSVMTLGNRNHILCTSAFAQNYLERKRDDNLERIGRYKPGGGAELELFNYHNNNKDVGSSEKPPGNLRD